MSEIKRSARRPNFRGAPYLKTTVYQFMKNRIRYQWRHITPSNLLKVRNFLFHITTSIMIPIYEKAPFWLKNEGPTNKIARDHS